MGKKAFSLLIVDENREVRECLHEIFRESSFEVNVAEDEEDAVRAIPEDRNYGPDVIVLGHSCQHAGLAALGEYRPQALHHASIIVFPSFRVTLPNAEGAPDRQSHACGLNAISNLVTLVRGLARKKDICNSIP